MSLGECQRKVKLVFRLKDCTNLVKNDFCLPQNGDKIAQARERRKKVARIVLEKEIESGVNLRIRVYFVVYLAKLKEKSDLPIDVSFDLAI